VNEFVLTGLVRRRAQLAGDIENTHEALRKMILDLENLDATIVQFDPDFNSAKGLPAAKGLERPGPDVLVLNVLRQAAEPLTTRDIALQLLVERVG